MKMKITDRELKRLPAKDQPYDISDTHRDSPPAFGARKMPSGELTFHLYRRFPGNPSPVRRALGRYGEMSLEQAREQARTWIAQIKAGVDPKREGKRVEAAAIEAERVRKSNTVESVLTAYLNHKSGLRTIHARGRELRRELQPWFTRPIANITEGDIKRLINTFKADGRIGQASALFTLLKAFFAWTADCGDYGVVASPAAKIKRAALIGEQHDEDKKARVLKDHEIASLWRASGELDYPLRQYFRLLLLSGVRRAEASDASWPEFASRRWTIPSSRMKGRPGKTHPHLVPVTPAIEALLSEIPRFTGGDFLFSNKGGTKPITAFSKAKQDLDAAMRADLEAHGHAFESWTIHDIRRTVRTKLPEIGVAKDIAERVIAHAESKIVQTYDLYQYEKEKTAALESWHRALAEITKPPLRAVA